MGWLLIADRGSADAPRLCEELRVAKSSVSVALRRMEQAGLVERFRVADLRRNQFRLSDDVFGRAFRAQMGAFQMFSELAERGLSIAGDDLVRRRRLENMRDMYSFMAERFPALLDEWEASQ